jgi:hypothetical protein
MPETCPGCGCGPEPQHADYPHEPGRLYDCPACEARCHCTPGYTQCVYTGEHNGTADDGQERHETAPYSHFVTRASGYVAGWFTQADVDSGRVAEFVDECNRLVPGDPAAVEPIPEWPVCQAHNKAVPCPNCPDGVPEPDPATAGVTGAPLPDVDARRAEVARLRDGLEDGTITPTEAQQAIVDGITEQYQLAADGNADGNPYTPYTPEHRVWAKAQEHGKAAASWVTDGNTSQETYRRLLEGIRDGDPEVLDSIHSPTGDLSEGGDYTTDDLMADAGWVPHDGTDLRDELAEQYSRDVPEAFWHEVERTCRDQVEPVTEPGQLNEVMEFDHVVRVLDEHRVTDAKDSYAPELIMFVNQDGQAEPDSDEELASQAGSADWQLLTGWTGQHGYRGPVMHPSEYVGGALADHILNTPGEYVVTAVETDDDSDEPAGWAIAYREACDDTA